MATQEIAFRVHQAGVKSSLPQRSGSLVSSIEALNVALSQVFHHQRHAIRLMRREKQMNVIGHQDVRVQGALEALRQLIKQREIQFAIAVPHKASAPVHAALYDMQGKATEPQACSSRHDTNFAFMPS